MSLGKLVATIIRFISFVSILMSFQLMSNYPALCQERANNALVTFSPLQITWDESTLQNEFRRARITASLLAGKALYFSDLGGLAQRLSVIRQRLERYLINHQFENNTPTIVQLARQLDLIEARHDKSDEKRIVSFLVRRIWHYSGQNAGAPTPFL